MTVTFLAALLVQCIMVALLRHRLGRRWLRRPVTVLVLASVVELGIAPGLLAVPSIGRDNVYRHGIQRGFVDSADLIMSVAMLALTLGYLLTRPERTATPERPGAIIVTRAVDWRLLAVACIPLVVITAAGHGYNNGAGSGPGTSLSSNLAVAFFVVTIVTASAAFVLRHGSRWFLIVLIIQSVVLAAAGERTPVLMDAIALVLMLLFAGIRVPRLQLAVAAGMTVLVILSISGVRLQEGRALFYTDSGLSTRITALATGVTAVGETQGGTDSPGLLTQFAIRMSSVDFGGAILQAISEGQPRLSPAYVPESLLLAVPSFIWPTKLNHSTTLDPTQLQIEAFGLQNINFIPGLPGLYIGFLAPQWLVILFGLLGAVLGWFERWLLRECTPARFVLFGGSVVAALGLEAGLPTMLVQMRSAAALALAVHLIRVLRVRAGAAGPRSLPPVPNRRTALPAIRREALQRVRR